MTRQYVNTLTDGVAVSDVYLLADKQMRANRNADLYLLAQLRDKTGLISGLMWNVAEETVSDLEPGNYVRVKGKVQLFQGNLQIILTNISRVADDSVEAEEFIPQPATDSKKNLARLSELIGTITEPSIKALMLDFLADPAIVDSFMKAPAGVKTHHSYQGGLLDHVVNLTETAVRIRDLYQKVNFDLVIAGILLHDIGKIRELEYETIFGYTDEGQLLGHLQIGCDMLQEKLLVYNQRNPLPFPQEYALRLKHMILSHHGSYEFGSPKLPMTLEAIVLNYLDNLDAKVNEFLQMMDSDPNRQSSWTPYNSRIDRKLYKGIENRGESS
jgi:3'-5' exoribonuclease